MTTETARRYSREREILGLREDRRVLKNTLDRFAREDCLRLKEGFAFVSLPRNLSEASQTAIGDFFNVYLKARSAP